LKPVSEIVLEYTQAAARPEAYQKAKWGSRESMLNRFRLALDVVDWKDVRVFADVGCGVGLLFEFVQVAGHAFRLELGMDITPDLARQARRNLGAPNRRFLVADAGRLPLRRGSLDLLTMIGVLQQCGRQPREIIEAALESLRPGGQLFLTTKHLGWEEFTSGRLQPEPLHSWFHAGELAGMVAGGGGEIVRLEGFLPRENRVVPLEQSHSLFLLARKA